MIWWIQGLTPSGYRLTSFATEPTECLVLTRRDSLAALRGSGVEMSIVNLEELARGLRYALDSFQ
jgi:hypothetical protein